MLKSENIICISSIDWDFVWQGHQEIMSAFAKNGNRVLFIENTGVRTPTIKDIPRLKKRIISWFRGTKGFRREMDNLFVYSPMILPFQYSKFARWINKFLLLKPLKRWMRAIGFYDPVIWTFLPTGIALDIISGLEKRLLVYYCIADFAELVNNPSALRKTEESLIKECDVVFVQGKVLEEKCRKLNENVFIFPFGVNTKVFDNFQRDKLKITPEDIKDIRKPVIGYIGGIHKHIDFELIRQISEEHPEWSIVLIGPLQTDVSTISGLPNVFFLGKKQFTDLPAYIYGFDVGIIPYLKSEYTKTVYPTKMNEYHIMGKPIVSTALPEVAEFNRVNGSLIYMADSRKEFINLISLALENNDLNLMKKREFAARKNSWDIRIEEMGVLVEAAIDKKYAVTANWREKLVTFYNLARKKTISLLFVFLTFFSLVYYTPLVWFLASPLKISQAPEKADCIVVFGGGVGESGRAGQGYEERVKYAVELYMNGYARNLLFSSGYTYVFKEPVIMKILAVSLGVPSDAVIIEDRATKTYDNVRFTKDILDVNKWNKILLVSSPYHMRRVSLVFMKNAKNIKVIYAPILNSLFYAPVNSGKHNKIRMEKITLQQIKGIAHEYLGILYYWIKGWI